MGNYKRFAITGGIGSGKTFASNILKEAGYTVISADNITTKLYKKRKIRLVLKGIFPSAIKGIFLKIDRKEISRIAFNDDAKHKQLTDAITPLVMEEIRKKCKKIKSDVFVEVPLLFECNEQDNFDEVLVVMRPLKDRIESVKVRSNLSEEDIVARMNRQVDYNSFDLSKHIILLNDCDAKKFRERVLDIAKSLIK